MTRAARPPVLVARELAKSWRDGARRIDVEVSRLTLRPGELKVVAGPSGSGKSTVLDMLALALRPDRAEELRVDLGQGLRDVAAWALEGREASLSACRAAAFGYVVQSAAMIPFLRVREDIALQQEISGRPDPALAERYARRLDILDCLDRRPGRLSAGQRQRAALVRAAACRPRVLLADEPTSALDPVLKRRAMELLIEAAEAGAAVVVVTHDVSLIEAYGLSTVAMDSGETDHGWRTRFADAAEAAA